MFESQANGLRAIVRERQRSPCRLAGKRRADKRDRQETVKYFLHDTPRGNGSFDSKIQQGIRICYGRLQAC